jgi:hypothetical protein
MSRLSLAEILGKKGAKKSEGRKLTLEDLGDLVGENLPEINFDAVGKHRLVTALRNRFGEGYRSIPAAKDIIADFEEKRSFEERLSQLRGIKYTPKTKG